MSVLKNVQHEWKESCLIIWEPVDHRCLMEVAATVGVMPRNDRALKDRLGAHYVLGLPEHLERLRTQMARESMSPGMV